MSNINRLYIDQSFELNSSIFLSKEHSHYLANVLRKKLGDTIKIFNGTDGQWLAEIIEFNKKLMTLSLTERLREQEEEMEINLIFSPIKNSRMPYLIEKATELGVTNLIPVLLENSVGKSFNVERATAIAIEAAEQCERLSIPKIHEIIKLENLIKTWNNEYKILFCDERKTRELKSNSIFETLSKNEIKPYTILIGPEGGFSEKENIFLNSLSYILPVSLGLRILRAETAAIVALTCVQFIRN